MTLSAKKDAHRPLLGHIIALAGVILSTTFERITVMKILILKAPSFLGGIIKKILEEQKKG